MSARGDLERLGRALAAEHAAVYAYGLLGGRTKGALRARVTAGFDAHRSRRDQLRSMIVTRGGRPVESEASYAIPVTPGTGPQAVDLAVLVEEGVVAAYLELAACDDRAVRRFAAAAMQESATRAYGLRPRLSALPGMPAAERTASPAPSAETG